ncbi:MAG: hypothetical protein WC509_07265 [Candidatus Izemoplasmatales bacterium]
MKRAFLYLILITLMPVSCQFGIQTDLTTVTTITQPIETTAIPTTETTTETIIETSEASTTTTVTTAVQPVLEDLPSLGYYHEIMSQTDELDQPLAHYFVYLYNDACSHCVAIEAEVAGVLTLLKDAGIAVFVVDTAVVQELTVGDRDAFLESIDEISIKTPSLIEVSAGAMVKYTLGSTAIPIELDRLESTLLPVA